jgi:Na+(H+)/acetate symporter ActP
MKTNTLVNFIAAVNLAVLLAAAVALLLIVEPVHASDASVDAGGRRTQQSIQHERALDSARSRNAISVLVE